MTYRFKEKYQSFFQPFLFSFCYGIGFYILQYFFARIGMFSVMPTAESIKTWDVYFYNSIKEIGYVEQTNNTGFFILLPLIWKITHLGVWGMCLFNIFCFSLGFAFLMKTVNEENKIFWLLCLTLPSVYFAFIPYTEALFFLFCSLLFYGIDKRKFWIIFCSLFLVSLVRATAFFLLPALVVMEVLSNSRSVFWKSLWKSFYTYILPVLIATVIFILYQYSETGIWFAYFKKQSTHWGHVFSWPGTPFSNIEGALERLHWLSALAMLVNSFAVIHIVYRAVLWIKDNKPVSAHMALVTTYMSMILISLLFLNPKYGAGFTNLMGANRYTFISPFFFYFLYYYYNKKFSPKEIVWTLVFVIAYLALFFGSLRSLQQFVVTGLIPLVGIATFLFYTMSKERRVWMLVLIICFNFFAQLHLFQQFITPLYMD